MGEINRVAFRIFSLPIYWYAIFIVTGILLAVYLAQKEALRVGMGEEDVFDFILWALLFGIAGARLYYVILDPAEYLADPIQILNIRGGGLAVYGGLIAGAVVMYVFCKKRQIPFWTFLDVAAPGVILAQGLGRWGNFLNQEAYGGVTSRAFLESLHIPAFIIDNMYIGGEYRQPAFFYEFVWDILGFGLLLFLRSRPHLLKKGEVFLGYIIWYSFGRFFIEGIRTDSLMLGGLRFSQVLSAGLFIGGLLLVVVRRKKGLTSDYTRDLGGKKGAA